MIQKLWLLLAPLVVLLAVHGVTGVQPAESPKAIKSETLKKTWALILTTPGGDPVEVSKWRFRKTCEIERASMVRIALHRGTAVSGTRCVALSWLIWFRYLLGKEQSQLESYSRLKEYLEEASNRATQEDVASVFARQRRWSSKSPIVRELPTGHTVWAYKERFEIISSDGKPVTPPLVFCYVLTFDKEKILLEWRHGFRQGDCWGPAAGPP